MSPEQFRDIVLMAAGFLFGNILVWLSFGAYLLLTGRG
jgi:hypothetical protein